ncbi:MAG: hypothetical protein ACP5KV_07180, partial [Candidatus Methanomethylicaceae archaeon]
LLLYLNPSTIHPRAKALGFLVKCVVIKIGIRRSQMFQQVRRARRCINTKITRKILLCLVKELRHSEKGNHLSFKFLNLREVYTTLALVTTHKLKVSGAGSGI